MADDKFSDEDGEMVEKTVSIMVGEKEKENDNTKYESGKEELTEKDRVLAKRKEVAKKGISITRALISFGYENWIALEPGSIFYVSLQYTSSQQVAWYNIMFGC